MDASEIVVQTEAGYDPELNPDSEPGSDSESTRSNGSEERELNRRRVLNESPDDIRDFTHSSIRQNYHLENGTCQT